LGLSFDGKSKRVSSITNPCGARFQYTTRVRAMPPNGMRISCAETAVVLTLQTKLDAG